MATRISSIHVHNYRALADVHLDLGAIGVLFGPNGSGKSTLLDTLWFVRDCAIRGVEVASSQRSHGIGVLFDGTREDDQRISSELQTDTVSYALQFDLTSGRIDPSPGERLTSLSRNEVRIDRDVGSQNAWLYNSHVQQSASYQLRDPEKLTLSLYLGFNPADEEAGSLDRLLHFVRLYHSRSFFLHRLKTHGSESSPDVRLWEHGDNAWSVLRNLHDRKNRDDRFETIMRFMREAFPSLEDIVLEQTGPTQFMLAFLSRAARVPSSRPGYPTATSSCFSS